VWQTPEVSLEKVPAGQGAHALSMNEPDVMLQPLVSLTGWLCAPYTSCCPAAQVTVQAVQGAAAADPADLNVPGAQGSHVLS
jgi:hypothetical protein